VADVSRTATCRALTPVTAARLDRRTFEELFRRNVGVHARFQLVIARSLAADLRGLRGLLVAALLSGDEGALRERFAPAPAPDRAQG
jgi:CRP-like cAMP-binding protein